ncbi:MAG: hypothetical protein WDZ53_09620, partial [Balneolales bacterium]
RLKLKVLAQQDLPKDEYERRYREVTEKLCLCEGLETSVIKQNGISLKSTNAATAVCPGPNLAYFSAVYSLTDLINHIYGRLDVIKGTVRPHLFIKELGLYIDYFRNELIKSLPLTNPKQARYFDKFKFNLMAGITYYREKLQDMADHSEATSSTLNKQLTIMEEELRVIWETSSGDVETKGQIIS